MDSVCPQRAWVEALRPGTFFRTRDVPGPTRGAVSTFLSREASKPAGRAVCRRVAPNLYWKPRRNERGVPIEPDYLALAGAIAGRGHGMAGHDAGIVAGWLTHTVSATATVAVVGEPSVRRPLPTLLLRARANTRRRALTPLEVTYLEAIASFEECAEVDWPAALRITERQVGHRGRLRTRLMLAVAAAERGPGSLGLRGRLGEFCDVVSGLPPPAAPVLPPPPRPVLDRRLVTAADLPSWMAESPGSRIGALSTFVNHWAHYPHHRAALCAAPPRGENRLDLVRIAATVHALCDRDAVEVPHWVWANRWHEDVAVHSAGTVTPELREIAPAACRLHRVWFADDHIMCISVHGFWNRRHAA